MIIPQKLFPHTVPLSALFASAKTSRWIVRTLLRGLPRPSCVARVGSSMRIKVVRDSH